MKRDCAVILLTIACGAREGQAADQFSTPSVAATNVGPHCGQSAWDWLRASTDDCALTYRGFTVYGALDVGYGYDTAGIGFGRYYDKGIFYTVQKTSVGPRWSWSPNALSASTIGVKMDEKLDGGWSLIGAVEIAFNPFSLSLDNGPKSLADNNLSPLAGQTANGDSSRAGQWDNSLGYLGLSNPAYGSLSVGRMVSLSNEIAASYDPTRSNAFSLIGNSGPFPRFGYPELVRVNTGVRYQLQLGNYRVGALAQIGNGFALGNGSMGQYEAQVGATFGSFSVDLVARYATDAVSLQTFSGAAAPAGYDPFSILQATLADVTTVLAAVRYRIGDAELYGGYTFARLGNPHDAFANGFQTIADGIFVPPGEVNAAYYEVNQILNTFWIGAKYDLSASLSVAGSFTYQHQNNFLPGPAVCSGSGAETSSPRCAGAQSAISAILDYEPFPRVDIYAGVMLSNVYGGMASGYFKTQNIDPTIGLRVRF